MSSTQLFNALFGMQRLNFAQKTGERYFIDLYPSYNVDEFKTDPARFEQVKREIESNSFLQKNFKAILAVPEIAENLAESAGNEEDSYGWKLLAESTRRWLSYECYYSQYPAISVVPFNFAWMKKYRVTQEALKRLVQPGMMSTENARKYLMKALMNDARLWENGGRFDFSKFEQSKWNDWYTQFAVVNRESLPIKPDGITAALASCTLRALPKGQLIINADGRRRVVIDGISIYGYDTFNFEESKRNPVLAFFDDYLGYWNDSDKQFSMYPPLGNSENFIKLDNTDFNKFRNTYRKGMDLQLISNAEYYPYRRPLNIDLQ